MSGESICFGSRLTVKVVISNLERRKHVQCRARSVRYKYQGFLLHLLLLAVKPWSFHARIAIQAVCPAAGI